MGDSILVRVRDSQGRVGIGECAPRSYVTGESNDSVARVLLEEFGPRFVGLSFAQFDELTLLLGETGAAARREQLAAFCALELALLDLGGQVFHRSAGEVLGPEVHKEVRYSGVVSADEPQAVARTCAMLLEFGVREVKAKVGRSREEDIALLGMIREKLGDEISLRVDANCAWDAVTASRRLRDFEAFRLDGLEQPCAADALEESARVRSETDVSIILDESVASWDDAQRAIEAGAGDAFNIRISKCGGLILSGRLRDLARSADLGCMLGAQVGESAVLSAAGRMFAVRSSDLWFLEGSNGSFLLESDLSDDMQLQRGGMGYPVDGPGLGIAIDLTRGATHISEEQEIRA
jgi:muconate cycloisomerase